MSDMKRLVAEMRELGVTEYAGPYGELQHVVVKLGDEPFTPQPQPDEKTLKLLRDKAEEEAKRRKHNILFMGTSMRPRFRSGT